VAAGPGGVRAGRRGRSGWFMPWVVSAGQEPAGRGAGRSGWVADAAAAWRPAAADAAVVPPRAVGSVDAASRDLPVSRRVGAAHLQLTARVAVLAGRPCRAARSATGPLMVVRPPGTAAEHQAPVPVKRGACGGAVTAAVHPRVPSSLALARGWVGSAPSGPGAAGGATSTSPAIRRLTRSQNRVGSVVSSRVLRRLRSPGR
jgi:hypothetical protein